MRKMSVTSLLAFICACQVLIGFASSFAPSPLLLLTSHRQSSLTTARLAQTSAADYESKIVAANDLLYKAAETKAEDPDEVFEALSDLEKLMRKKSRDDPNAAQDVLDNLNGSWRLIFTTGTKKTQERVKGRINYFPLKAVQSFDTTTTPFSIENGIYIGDWSALRFNGSFEFNLKSRKLEFEFNKISIFGFTIDLGQGMDAKLGKTSGLGADSNVELQKQGKKAFFNWISADAKIATARGGGGGLALWKRVEQE